MTETGGRFAAQNVEAPVAIPREIDRGVSQIVEPCRQLEGQPDRGAIGSRGLGLPSALASRTRYFRPPSATAEGGALEKQIRDPYPAR